MFWAQKNYSELPPETRAMISITRPLDDARSFGCSDGRMPSHFYENRVRLFGAGDGAVAAASSLLGILPEEALVRFRLSVDGYVHVGHGDDHGEPGQINPRGCGARVLIAENHRVLGLRDCAVSEIGEACKRLDVLYGVRDQHRERFAIINDCKGMVINPIDTPFQVFVYDRWAAGEFEKRIRVSGFRDFTENMFIKGVEHLKPGTPVARFYRW